MGARDGLLPVLLQLLLLRGRLWQLQRGDEDEIIVLRWRVFRCCVHVYVIVAQRATGGSRRNWLLYVQGL